jgi:hypothetical protein
LSKKKEKEWSGWLCGVWGGAGGCAIPVLISKFLYHATELYETWNVRHAL